MSKFAIKGLEPLFIHYLSLFVLLSYPNPNPDPLSFHYGSPKPNTYYHPPIKLNPTFDLRGGGHNQGLLMPLVPTPYTCLSRFVVVQSCTQVVRCVWLVSITPMIESFSLVPRPMGSGNETKGTLSSYTEESLFFLVNTG